jgi:cyclopropane-fatty-acyl-phospholipid synthase
VTERALRFALNLRYGSLTIGLPNGRWVRIEGAGPGPHGTVVIHDLSAVSRFVRGGDIAFAEAYFDGQWDSPDLTAFLQVFSVNLDMINDLAARLPLANLAGRIRHWLRRNTKRNARRNIFAHYDLGNAFFASWLDETMTYSSAVFADEAQPLAHAQMNKYATLARSIAVGPDHHVLEVGCGWGGFAEFAAKELGCRVTGLTISPAQYDFARERMFKAGLNERVSLKLQDYRDEAGIYDRIVSIEMIEAVGEKYWPVYFSHLRDCLVPGGVAGLQGITISEAQFEIYRRQPDFVQAYIFPGGMLPSRGVVRKVAGAAGLAVEDDNGYGLSYARTLADWRTRFLNAWSEIADLGFDARFKRLWTY